MNLQVFTDGKAHGRKITMMTCYDYSSARILRQSAVDAFLVGDSLAMTLYGHDSTLPATTEMMARHTAAVRKGLGPDRALIADLPFLEHRGSLDRAMDAVRALMVAGADAVKLEGIRGHEALVGHIVESGIPVMGHLGLTPQAVHGLGGYRVQGRDKAAAEAMIEQARTLQEQGVFALVLECVPEKLAATIAAQLELPVIGIGAGSDVDGQVLVQQDLLGMNLDFSPRFVRAFAATAEDWIGAVDEYCRAVQEKRFPAAKESFQ
ncbi:3-methyl-2-oxobutanoate hydroxymethyltransferase [Wenzhouxiangella limi]|uniref:3-methyl-2-oxobutanoate hydroxymethyltransferase n=1 Tax=Wenzhouxiangella limi TaxID=2707351 RepID=A0A845VGN2_9GAMM|nr:3-methyl-2-oxobutanoate hydroxymethyltransferase [Wenzhouxiangella limi]